MATTLLLSDGIRIEGGPGGHQINVYDLDTGEKLTNVSRVEIDAGRLDGVRAEVTIEAGYDRPITYSVRRVVFGAVVGPGNGVLQDGTMPERMRG